MRRSANTDLAVIGTTHPSVDREQIALRAPSVLDLRGVLRQSRLPSVGLRCAANVLRPLSLRAVTFPAQSNGAAVRATRVCGWCIVVSYESHAGVSRRERAWTA